MAQAGANAADMFLVFGGGSAAVSRTGHLTAWCRALSRRTDPPEIANGDFLAEHFLLPHQRASLTLAGVTRRLLDARMPGAVAYFSGRTRHLDAVLCAELDAGAAQVVVLGAGFDSRALRFEERLGEARVFEVDFPEVLALKARYARDAGERGSKQLVPVPMDLGAEDLRARLREHGYREDLRTIFLWEGVTYYLRAEEVRSVLRFVREHSGPGSSLAFDYVTQAFTDGDHSPFGARELAEGWRRMGNVHRSGVADVRALLATQGLSLRSDIDAQELEHRYLTPPRGAPRRPWGVFHLAHAGHEG